MTKIYSDIKTKASNVANQLIAKPRIRVSLDMSGFASGADEILEAFEDCIKKYKEDVYLTVNGGFGMANEEPLIDIKLPDTGRVFYSKVNVKDVENIFVKHVINRNPIIDRALAVLDYPELNTVLPELYELPMMKKQLRIALRNAGHIDPENIYEYINVGGYAALEKALSTMDSDEVIDEVIKSGLRGRGGAAFQTGVKWKFLKGSKEPKKFIIGNCEEGDPGAFNDKSILESDPHTLIEGMILAGFATRASNGIVFIRHGHNIPIDRTRLAIKQAYELGFIGENIFGSDFSFDIEVVLVGESYVSGEETALMDAIEGKRAMPRFRPPFPATYGVWGKPSNINNIKTLSYIPAIVGNGSDWFSNIGTAKSTGTAMICLSGNISQPGLVEVPMGLTIREVIDDCGGGVPGGKEVKLLQTGGPLGGVLSAAQLDIPIDFDAMAKAGAILGSGGIIVGDTDVCAVDLARLLVAFCQYESCGKCFPCRLGTTHLLEILQRICNFKAQDKDLELMTKIGSDMQVGSLCGHGQLGFNPIKSALDYFGDEFNMVMKNKKWPTTTYKEEFFMPDSSLRNSADRIIK